MTTDYTALVAGAHADKVKFLSVVALVAGAVGNTTGDLIRSLITAFDVDVAEGHQLDVIGEWVGVTRKQTVPIANIYFTWNDAALGWNAANWKGQFEVGDELVSLDDLSYRVLLKGVIASNYWDGTNEGANQIGSAVLAPLGLTCVVIDNFDMTMEVQVTGTPSIAVKALIERGFVPPKPAGVSVTYTFL